MMIMMKSFSPKFEKDYCPDLLSWKELSDLVNLSKSNLKNNYARALCYQLFENNGVIKREKINQTIKNITKEDRLILRKAGIKIVRYNIFLPKT